MKNKFLFSFFYFDLFFFHIFFRYINSQSTDCDICYSDLNSCPSKCKETLLHGYFFCDISSSKTNKYFYINIDNSNTKTCLTIKACPEGKDKVVAETRECVLNCGSYYEVGDFCFKELNNDDNYYGLDYNTPSRIKNCRDYYYYELIDGKKFITCVDDPQKDNYVEDTNPIKNFCPNLYYDINDKKCVTSCENKKIKKKTAKDGKEYYECRNECEYKETSSSSGDYEYEESQNDLSSNNVYCLGKCPANAPYYYKISSTISPKCIKKCNTKDFYNKNNQCFSKCDYLHLQEDSKDFFRCFNPDDNEDLSSTLSSNKCPNTHPYRYQNACLKSCRDTELNIFFNKQTYSVIDGGKKYCVDDCFTYDNKYFSDSESSTCVENCMTTRNKFHYNHMCLNSCSDYEEDKLKYYLKKSLYDSEDSSENEEDNDYECVKECPNGYYKYDETICLKSCPKLSNKPYIDMKKKECTSCQISEGYILSSEMQTDKKYCYESCPSNTYHKINDNLCYDSIQDNCFFKEDDNTVCYSSCKDIRNEGYTYEKDNICYKANICGDQYYYEYQGITKCLEDKVVTPGGRSLYVRECSKINYLYLDGKKCISKCREDEYIIEPESTIYEGITILGKCCQNPNCDNEYPYYSNSEKILKKECKLKFIEKKGENVIKSSEGTCVSECPTDYPYESEDGDLCLLSCPNYYYIKGNTKKCVENCQTIGKFHFEGESECLNNCSKNISNKLIYYYYDPDDDTKTCLTSCKSANENKFSLNATLYPQPCLLKCPLGNKYYYGNINICLPSCINGFHKNNISDECVTQCGIDEFVINDDVCSTECTSQEPYYVTASKTIGSNVIIYNKCVLDCFEYDSKYKYFDDESKQCLEDCLPYTYKYKNGKKCFKKCPDGLYTDIDECKQKCEPPKYYLNSDDGNENKCVNNCGSMYISLGGVCVKNCYSGENFIQKNRQCNSTCGEDGPYFKNIADESIEYEIYLCKKYFGDPGELLVDETNEIVIECPDHHPYLSETEKKCFANCYKENSLFPFSTQKNNAKICSSQCDEDEYYGLDDKVCKSSCEGKIINDENNSCVDKCDPSSLFNFTTLKEDGEIHCSKQCEKPTPKFMENENLCVEICLAPDNYVYNNKCYNKCPNGLFAVKNEAEYICEDNCGEDYYYKKDKKCISKEQCVTINRDYIIQDTNECISNCSSIDYYFYDFISNDETDIISGTSRKYEYNICVKKCPEDKPYAKGNKHCSKECDIDSEYYGEDKICKKKCDTNMVSDGYECKKACPINKFWDKSNNSCIDSCLHSNNRYYYYAPPDNTCIKDCDENSYKDGYKCVSSCPEEKKYAYDKRCTDNCPEIYNYVIKDFTHNEENMQRICNLTCPDEYPYYIEDKTNGINYCVGTCSYYILPTNNNIKSIQCYENGCPETHNYYIRYENGTNQCLPSCPKDFPFYIPIKETGGRILDDDNEDVKVPNEGEGEEEKKNIRCYEKCQNCNNPNYCPETEVFRNKNSYECIEKSECDPKIIDYDKKECVFECSFSQLWAKDGEIKYCLSKCNKDLGEYEFNNECIKECDPDKFLITDYANKKCICKFLFYKPNIETTICIDPDIATNCGESPTASEYKYRIYNSNECSQYCFGYLSPSEDICYLNITDCEEIDINTKLVIDNDKRKCDCKYKYYTDTSSGKKICLGKNEECNVYPYYMYTPKTKECVISCKALYGITFENQCFAICPIDSEDKKRDKCECAESKKLLVKVGEEKYKCYENNCQGDFPYIIKETAQCVKKCLGTGYEILYKNQCYLSCSSLPGMKQIKMEDEKLKEIALYTCQCETLWYYQNGEIECPTENIVNKCSEIENKDFKYLIKDTNECVTNCPNNYVYFNDECFKSCEDAKNKYQYSVIQYGDSKECICETLWERVYDNDNDSNNNGNDDDNKGRIVCLKNITCKNLMVEETKECVNKCPDDFPLEYNKICYKKGNCPEGTKEDIIGENKCICENLWLKQENGNLYCINEDKCPDSHPYKIVSSKECTAMHCNKSTYKKIFNYECYETCPDGKVNKKVKNSEGEEVESDECECNPQFGYWYIEGNKKPMMICGKEKCPDFMPFIKNSTMQCLTSCSKNNLYRLDNICYENGCPYPTVSENAVTNKYECTTKKYTTAINLTESLQFVNAEIVNLYKSVPKGGIVYNNFSSTMQIYGISKSNSDSKDFLRSSLSYIDLGSCKDKVYENNKMNPDDDIIVVKYDLDKQVTKALVKSVEYEFINSRNGQILDMSVCKKDEVLISYSLSDILNFNFQAKKRNLDDDDADGDGEEDSSEESEEIEVSEETKKIILEIQKQYNKGKEIYLKYNIDTFNINSSIYNDMCFSFPIDGKDLILEDRVKYFYPYYSLCEANCSYSSTDFELERIYCNCPLKKELDFDREQKFVINQNNIDEIRSKQKGPSNVAVMGCLSTLGDKGVSNNGAFFYSLLIMILEVGLILITIFYSFKKLKNKINKNRYKNKEEKENEFEDEKKGSQNIKNNEIIYKTSERALNAPPKKREMDIESVDPNDIKLENKNIDTKINNKDNDGIETEDPRFEKDEENNNSFAKEYEFGILNEIQKEEELLRIKFELSIQRDKSDIFITLLTEVCEKIYLFKILFLLGKYDMFTIYLSLYLLYHILFLTMVTLFYDIKTIQNIWNKENYPSLSFDLGYGLLAALVVWILYRLFLCLLNNDNIIRKYFKKNISSSISSENDDLKQNSKLLNKLMNKIRNGMIIYFGIEIILVLICLLYLTSFAAVYVGTKAKIFKTYGIGLTEVLILKIVYGLILGILRKVGLNKEKKFLYNISYYFDKFIY